METKMKKMTPLRTWLEQRDMKQIDLAGEVAMAYPYIAEMVRGDREPSDGFKVRFIERYGEHAAREAGLLPSGSGNGAL